MNKTLALAAVLVAFTAYSVYAISVHGLIGFFETELSTPAGIQVFVDLVIALTCALFWMAGDARERGLPFWPYLVLTLCVGSIGLLSYLIHRELRAPQRATA
jgi:hypothetical protein